MGIRDRPISPGSPWQNPYAERLIGTIRRECLDRMLVFGEAHLRQILSFYAKYYNQIRTHLALDKDAPLGRGSSERLALLPSRFCPACITTRSGYDFRKGQVRLDRTVPVAG
jgi:transposase InsO family protein